MNLRVIGLAAATAAAVLLPLAAFAGTAGTPGAGDGRTPAGALPFLSARPADGAPEPPGGLVERDEARAAADGTGGGSPFPPRPIERCGPELASPDGVEAQTCVMAEGGETWARAYYRNATGEELTAVLSLMAPGGRAWQANCLPHEGDEPGTCETPRAHSLGAPSAYMAVAEFAARAAGGDGPLLLRAGSNSVAAEGR
ncbi:hypothetical protein [Streptomyces sp. t39]|uniref:hypothetical protein n=1 Tax=Streptomyces sp. t39 TaxID=1828156 RepID=UPI0011CDCCD9|nr:hypothetical protein [Streptomyces sp. t39]TXS55908.1 hypothetical protein EAO77_06990 [Streptomyces sp. t39]